GWSSLARGIGGVARTRRGVYGVIAYNANRMGRGLVVTLAVIGLIVVGVVVWAVGINNSLVRSGQDVNEKRAQGQDVYQRRADMIPNLGEPVKDVRTEGR